MNETNKNAYGDDKHDKGIGKLEICGRIGDKLVLKQLHARSGHEQKNSRLLVRQLTEDGGWLDDLQEATT